MDKLRELFDKYINEGLKKVVISNARKKDGASKLQVRPILLKMCIRDRLSSMLSVF